MHSSKIQAKSRTPRARAPGPFGGREIDTNYRIISRAYSRTSLLLGILNETGVGRIRRFRTTWKPFWSRLKIGEITWAAPVSIGLFEDNHGCKRVILRLLRGERRIYQAQDLVTQRSGWPSGTHIYPRKVIRQSCPRELPKK